MRIGSFLKLRREQKKITIGFLSSMTKIPIYHLINLEENNLESLPHKTFVHGFLRILAKVLDYDDIEAIEIFEFNLKEVDLIINDNSYQVLTFQSIELKLHKESLFYTTKRKTFFETLITQKITLFIFFTTGLFFIASLLHISSEN